MLKAIAGKDNCPNCGELLIGNTINRSLKNDHAICSVCKVSFDELERIEMGWEIPGMRRVDAIIKNFSGWTG